MVSFGLTNYFGICFTMYQFTLDFHFLFCCKRSFVMKSICCLAKELAVNCNPCFKKTIFSQFFYNSKYKHFFLCSATPVFTLSFVSYLLSGSKSSLQTPLKQSSQVSLQTSTPLPLTLDSRPALAPTRPKVNSLLHLFGAWLVEAALVGVKVHGTEKTGLWVNVFVMSFKTLLLLCVTQGLPSIVKTVWKFLLLVYFFSFTHVWSVYYAN